MKPGTKRNLLVLTLVILAVGLAVLLRFRALNVRGVREVRTRAKLYHLSSLVALINITESPFESPLDSQNILSVLGLEEHEFTALVGTGMTVRDGRILDSWGNPIRLTILNNEACLVSVGGNGRPDSDKRDDIVKCFPVPTSQ